MFPRAKIRLTAFRLNFFLVSADTVPIMHEGSAWAWMTLSEIAQLRLGFEQMKIAEFMLRIWGDALDRVSIRIGVRVTPAQHHDHV